MMAGGNIGLVLEVDNTDHTVNITFMEKKEQLFQWPRRNDIVWCKMGQILCSVQPPQPSGKSGRMLKLSQDDLRTIERNYHEWR